MSANIHYEVYVKKNQKSGWGLSLACEDRKEALETAKQIRKPSEQSSVRVVKESFDEAKDVFHSTQIFSQGPELHQRKLRENNRMDPPCSAPSDLYTLHARRTLGRALGPWLKRNHSSVVELLHRPDMAEKLAAAGFDRQHAIQKVAIAQAGSQECSVQHVVRRLTELADASTDRLRKLGKSGKLPGFQKKGYAATFASAQKHPEADFALRHALAHGLSPMKRWQDKIAFLSSCVSDALVEGKGCAASIHMLDEFISETVALPHALDQIVKGADLGDRLDRITDILIGTPPKLATEGAQMLAKAITSKRLPNTQSALAARMFRELCGPRRLYPEDFNSEVRLNRSLAARLTTIDPALAPVDQVAEAFTIRSSRLLENEAVQDFLEFFNKDAAQEIQALLQFEESIIGTQNKAKLASFLRAVIGSHKTRSWFSHGPETALARIAKIAHAQRLVQNTSFCIADLDVLFCQLDRLCADVIADTKVVEKIERRNVPPVETAQSLMKLIDGGIITIGNVSDDICHRALKLLRSASVKSALQEGDKPTIQTAREIGQMMERAKINAKK